MQKLGPWAYLGLGSAFCVSPKKGRIMCFDGKHYHASMHPMKSAYRLAITFNFT